MLQFKRMAVIAAGLCAVVLGGIGSSRVDAQATAQVRAVHVATGAPAVDISINGQELFSDLAPRSATDYDSVPAGRQRLRIVAANQPERAVLETEVDLQANTQLTLAVLGQLPTVRAVVLRDDNAPPADGQAKVRFVHGVPDAPPVNVATGQGNRLFDGVSYQSAAGYESVPAGTYDLQLRATDTAGVLVTVPDVTLEAGEIVTLFATGTAADNSLAAVPVSYGAGGTGGAGPTLPLAMPRTGTGLTADHGSGTVALPLIAMLASLAGMGLLLHQRGRARR